MILKTTLLAAMGALVIAASAAAPAQPTYSNGHHHARHARHCGFIRRPEYGLFGQRHMRWTIGCE